MLSFKDYGKGRPIAQISDGKLDEQIIFINEDSTKGSDQISIKDNGHLVPMPNIKERGVAYIAGASGSGKSTYAAQIIYNYRDLFPENKVFVFSRLKIDPRLDALGCVEVPINDELENVDIINDIENALCLFDDIDTIPNKKLKDLVFKICLDILETGRHKNIHIIVTSHLINGNDRKACRTILNEAQQITFFPKGGNVRSIRYLLRDYIGLSKEQIDKILKVNSRWITMIKSYPQCIFYEKGAMLVNSI
jgi:ABC-type dipeptide/oligopeptide/nickel transport system ATPase component